MNGRAPCSTFRWWPPPLSLGTSGWLEEGYVAFPGLVMDKIKRLELRTLPPADCPLADPAVVAAHLAEGRDYAMWDVPALLERRPEIGAINALRGPVSGAPA